MPKYSFKRGFIFLFLVLSATCLVGAQDDAKKVQEIIEAIKARGEPMTRSEVEQWHLLPFGVEDVSKIWLKGMEPMSELSYFERQPPIPPYLLLLGKKPFPLPYEDWPDLDRVEQHLKEFQPSIDEFHEAARRGGYGKVAKVHVWNEPPDAVGLFGSINAENLLTLDAVVQSRKGNTTACARSLSAAMLLSRAERNSVGVFGQTAFVAADEESARALAAVLCVTAFANDDLIAYRALIGTRHKKDQFVITMLEQRVINHLNLKEPQRPAYSPPPTKLPDADWLLFFEGSERIIANARKPFPECIDEAEKFRKELESQIAAFPVRDIPAPAEPKERVLRILRAYSYETWHSNFADYLIANRAADAGIAVELYRRENGRLPDSLEKLIPKYLSKIPSDPFSGKDLIYKRQEKGFTIYGLGKNRKHDDGKLDPKEGDSGLFFPITSKAN